MAAAQPGPIARSPVARPRTKGTSTSVSCGQKAARGWRCPCSAERGADRRTSSWIALPASSAP
ncbi:hypothetical protein T484DRAFT_1979732 [Baffinella frigidus]|nr:hypothetical protein T484DRAFT_1979732 [Cryptophyta sp. CCMP2293]